MSQKQQAIVLALAAAFMTTKGAAAPAPEKITLSYAEKTVDFLPFQIALDAGYFKNHGIDATVLYLPAQQGIPALITNQVQGVGIGGSDAVSAEAQGEKLEAVVTMTPTYIFQFWAHPQFKTAISLKRQRVGVTSTTGSLYAATLLALEQLGLKPSDVAMTPLGSVTNVNQSMLAGSVAAAASHAPATYRFQKAGFIDLIDLAQRKIPSLSAGLWFSRDYIKNQPATVQKVVDAVVDALNRERTDRAFTEREITKFLGVKDQGELDFTYNFYANEVLTVGPEPTAAQVEGNKKALAAGNPKLALVDPAQMVDARFIKKAKPD